MGGFMKPGWNLQMCRDRSIQHFNLLTYAQLIDDAPPQGRTRIRVCYLHTTSIKKPMTKTFPLRRGMQRQPEPVSYDRFHLFGIPNSPHVLVIFSEKEAHSKTFMRFGAHLFPGVEVLLLSPHRHGSINNTPVVVTHDPMIPMEDSVLNRPVLPPANVNQPGYVFFDFVSTNIHLIDATSVNGTCKGSVCDAQTGNDRCGCLNAPSDRHWALNVCFTCPQLDDISHNRLSLTSKRVTRLFMDRSVYMWPENDPRVDPFLMDDMVNDCFHHFKMRLLIVYNLYIYYYFNIYL